VTPSEYLQLIQPHLVRLFGEQNVIPEWDVAKNSEDDYSRELYCPKIDVAVGPFNIDGNVNQNNQSIDQAIQNSYDLMSELVERSETPVGDIQRFLALRNRNPRCFMAIELEASGTTKHRLGDIANTSILGAIGIVVPLTETNRKSFIRLKKYLEYGIDVDKLPPSFGNVLVITPNRFLEAIVDAA